MEDIENMGRILEEGEAEDVAAAVCNLCDGEVTGDCKGGNCESCCQSSRGTGLFQCCDGGYRSSGDASSAEAREAMEAPQEVGVEQAVDMDPEQQTEDVENAAVSQEMH